MGTMYFFKSAIFDGAPDYINRKFTNVLLYLLGKSAWQGAQTTIHLAIAKFSKPMSEIRGKYFSDCKSSFWWNVYVPKVCTDQMACKKVWEKTMRLLDL